MVGSNSNCPKPATAATKPSPVDQQQVHSFIILLKNPPPPQKKKVLKKYFIRKVGGSFGTPSAAYVAYSFVEYTVMFRKSFSQHRALIQQPT